MEGNLSTDFWWGSSLQITPVRDTLQPVTRVLRNIRLVICSVDSRHVFAVNGTARRLATDGFFFALPEAPLGRLLKRQEYTGSEHTIEIALRLFQIIGKSIPVCKMSLENPTVIHNYLYLRTPILCYRGLVNY